MTAVLAIIAISMSALVVSAPAANAAGSPAKPTCNTWFNSLPSWVPDPSGERAKCKARELWTSMDYDAAKVGREKSAAVRAQIVMKNYWAVAVPLAQSQPKKTQSAYYEQAFTERANKARYLAEKSPASAKAMMVFLRDTVASNQTHLNQMNSSIIALKGLSKVASNKYIKSPASKVLVAVSVPVIKDTYRKAVADRFLYQMLMK